MQFTSSPILVINLWAFGYAIQNAKRAAKTKKNIHIARQKET